MYQRVQDGMTQQTSPNQKPFMSQILNVIHQTRQRYGNILQRRWRMTEQRPWVTFYRKFRKARTRSFWEIQANRKTNKHTLHNTPHPSWGRSTDTMLNQWRIKDFGLGESSALPFPFFSSLFSFPSPPFPFPVHPFPPLPYPSLPFFPLPSLTSRPPYRGLSS